MASEKETQDVAPEEPVSPDSETPTEAAPVEAVSKADLSELRDELKGWIQEGTERTKQSQRDAIKARVPEVVRETLAAELEAIKKYAPDEKQKELQFEALMTHLTSEDSEPDEKPASSSPDESFVEREVRGVVEKHGLSGSEPELKQYMTDAKGQSLFDMLTGLDKVAVEVAEKRKATPAGILPGGSSPPAKPDLTEKYIKEISDLRVDRTMKAHEKKARMKEIKKKYKELDVPVDSIAFRI